MASRHKSSGFLKQGSILAFTGILVRIIGMVYRIPLTNIIGDEGNGIYSPAFEVYSLLLILSSNAMPLAVSKLVSAKISKRKVKDSKKILEAAFFYAFIAGGLCAVLLFFGATFIEKTFYSNLHGINLPFKILAPTIFVVALMGVLRGFFEGHSTMIPTSLSQIMEQIVNAIVSVYAAYVFIYMHSASNIVSAYGAAGGTMGTCIGAVSGFILLIMLFALFLPIYKNGLKKDKSVEVISSKTAFNMVFFTITPIILSQTVYQLSGTIDTVLFSKCMAHKNLSSSTVKKLLGIYSTKYRLLVNVPISISTALCSSMIPSMVRAYVNKRHDDVKSTINLAVKFNAVIAIPSAFGLSILSRPILRVLFPGSDYIIGGMMLIIGTSCIIFYSYSTIISGALQAIDRMRVPIINATISLVIHIIIVVFLLMFTPLNGYALVIGNVTYPLVVCILNTYSINKYLGYKQEIFNTFIKPIMVSVVMSLITLLIYWIINKITHRELIAVVISAFVAIVVYFVAILNSGAIKEKELLEFPFGLRILKFTKKLRIYRS